MAKTEIIKMLITKRTYKKKYAIGGAGISIPLGAFWRDCFRVMWPECFRVMWQNN